MSIKVFYLGQLKAFRRAGLATTVVCANDPELPALMGAGIKFAPVDFCRTLSPLRDLKTVWRLYGLFRNGQFDIVQYSTPKASLLGSIAAFLARTPVRVYIMWGLYYMGHSGVARLIFKTCEKIICSLSTHIVPISHEIVGFMEREGLTTKDKCEVMLNGSACGIDLAMFDPDKWPEWRAKIRTKYGIPQDRIVIGTVARLTGDKGINELVAAFDILSKETPVHLLLVGDREEKDRLLPSTERMISENRGITIAGWQENPLPYYAAMDIFCLPTYREGFGKVNLEGQAMGLPVVSTNVIGPRESIEDGVTGFLVEARNSQGLIGPLKRLAVEPKLRKQMGQAGRERIRRLFDSRSVIRAVVEHRLRLLKGPVRG